LKADVSSFNKWSFSNDSMSARSAS
jgi:hypothetical protein